MCTEGGSVGAMYTTKDFSPWVGKCYEIPLVLSAYVGHLSGELSNEP